MASTLQQYHQLADHMATQITGSYQSWTDFLTTAARLYKYPYHEQLMIYAQRPDATACAEYDLWNNRMGRYIRRGAKGIALIDHSGDAPKLKYVFDVADTRSTERFRSPYLWEYRSEHEKVVSNALGLQYSIQYNGDFADQLEQISSVKVTEYFLAHEQDLLGIVDGSYLERYHDYDKGVAFLNAATVSTTYMLLSRCGLSENAHFGPEDFMPVFDFNTPQTVDALGSAISGISEEILRTIEVTIKKYEREKLSERSYENDRTDLHSQRGLLDSQSEPVPAGEQAPGQVREDAESISSGASPGAVEPPDPVGEAVSPSAGDRRNSEPALGADDAGTDTVGGGNGGAESQRPHEMGGTDEQPESPGRGSDSDGAGLRLTDEVPIQGEQFSFFPTEAQQIAYIAQAESAEIAPSAFSMPQEYIDQFFRYNEVKSAHPDDIVLFQVGDFFEMYGEDAKQAAKLLELTLATRPVPGAGRVEMCGIPAHRLEQYTEKLREQFDVTIAAIPETDTERRIFTLRSVDHEAEAASDAQEAELGADGTQSFLRYPTVDAPQPTVAELFEQYKLTVGNALVEDGAFVNACRNSDRENAYLEGAAAIRRIVNASDDLQLTKLYIDMPTFHNRLHQELLDELYPTLATTVTPSPYKVTQADIDEALQQWNGRIESKHAVIRYMAQHGQEKDTAAWLAREYGLKDTSKPLQISVGNSEPAVLPWSKVRRRIAQLIKADKFYTQQEHDNFDDIDPIALREALAQRGIVDGRIVDAGANRNSPFVRQVMADVEQIAAQEARMDAPNRFSIRLYPNEGGITGIWDSALDRFYEEGGQVLRFAEQSNAIDYLSNIQHRRGIELDAPVFTTPLGIAYRIGDVFSSTAAGQRDTLMVIERVDEDNIWYTLPSVPEQAPVSVNRTTFERYFDTGYFTATEQKEMTIDPAERFHVVGLDRGFRTLHAVWDDETHGYYVNSEGVTEEFTSEWQAEAYRLELQGKAEQTLMERAKGLISEFCQREYGSEADFSDMAKIGVAYTTVTDDEIPIQVNIDLVNYRLVRYLDDEHLETRQYSSLQGMIDNELENLDFSDLIHVSGDELESHRWHEPTESEKLNNTPPIRMVTEDVQRISDEEFARENLIPDETTFEIDGRTFLVDRVNLDSSSVNFQDITFSNATGFPIFRTESISFVRKYVEEQEKQSVQPVTSAETVAVYPGEKTIFPMMLSCKHSAQREPRLPSKTPRCPFPLTKSGRNFPVLPMRNKPLMKNTKKISAGMPATSVSRMMIWAPVAQRRSFRPIWPPSVC